MCADAAIKEAALCKVRQLSSNTVAEGVSGIHDCQQLQSAPARWLATSSTSRCVGPHCCIVEGVWAQRPALFAAVTVKACDAPIESLQGKVLKLRPWETCIKALVG